MLRGIITNIAHRIKDNQCEWVDGFYQTGAHSPYTGDHVGRSERRCIHCNRRQMRIGMFSQEHQQVIIDKLGKSNTGYYEYKSGDWLDRITLEWLEKTNA